MEVEGLVKRKVVRSAKYGEKLKLTGSCRGQVDDSVIGQRIESCSGLPRTRLSTGLCRRQMSSSLGGVIVNKGIFTGRFRDGEGDRESGRSIVSPFDIVW